MPAWPCLTSRVAAASEAQRFSSIAICSPCPLACPRSSTQEGREGGRHREGRQACKGRRLLTP